MSHCGLGLSCEPIPCEHGKQLRKEQCHLCDIKREIIALTDMYKSLSIQVASQHEFKLNQIDLNGYLESSVDKLKNNQNTHSMDLQFLHQCNHSRSSEIKDLQEPIKRLESFDKSNTEILQNHRDSIEDLQKQITTWEEEFYFLKQKIRFTEEKPYKCPICNGEGNVIINNGQLLTSYPPQYPTKICHACEGKGIVWG